MTPDPQAAPRAGTQAVPLPSAAALRRAGGSDAEPALAGFLALLARHTAADAVSAVLLRAGEPPLGVTVRAGGDPTFRELLERTRAAVDLARASSSRPVEGLPTLALHPLPDGRVAAAVVPGEALPPAPRRLAAQLQVLLAGAAADPGAPLSALPLLPDSERVLVLRVWNDTAAPRPGRPLAHELFEARAASAPDSVAVRYRGAETTYGELNRRANRLAHRLRSLGVGPDVPVGVAMERGPELAAALLAVLKAGGGYVPLDPAYPRDRLAHMVADSGMRVLLTQRSVLSCLPTHAAQVVLLEPGEDAGAGWSDADPAGGAAPESLAYVVYTSGTTGRPKGVLVPHAALVNHNLGTVERFGLGPADRVLQLSSISFDISVEEIFPTWAAGGTVVFRADDTPTFGAGFLRWIEAEGVTALNLPTAFWHAWVADLLVGGLTLPPSLRLVVVGGEKALPQAYADWLSVGGGRVRWINTYGPTEATVIATAHEPAAGLSPDAGAAIPIGSPIANVRAYVLDARGAPVPAGVVGEIHLGGAGVTRGYRGLPGLTAERYLPDPFAEEAGARMYRTGDRARWRHDGELEFVGRTDDQVKVRGHRVEPGEVEAALCAHPAVRDAVVLPVEDAHGQPRLVAYVVPRGGGAGEAELREWLRDRVPAPMLPGVFVSLEALPLSPNGKVDRRALPAPGAGPSEAGEGFVSPRTPTQQALAEIWREALEVDRVGEYDSFAALGGHSLAGVRILSRVRQVWGVELPLRVLFEAPTLAALAERVDGARGADGEARPPVLPRPRGGTLPLSLAQQRLWFLHELEPESAAYHVPAAVRLAGSLDADALERALTEVVRRHDVLRTRISTRDGEPVQVVVPVERLSLRRVDLRHLPDWEREEEVERLAAEEARAPFDLGGEPPIRGALFRLGPADHLLVVTLHQVAGDGWSTEVVFREVGVLYDAFARGRPAALPELPFQYADFAAWQCGWLTGTVLDAQAAYWRGRLAGAPAALELPTDRPRAAVQGQRRGVEPFVLYPTLAEGVRALSRRQGATLFMTLLAALQAVLSRWAGQEEVVVGSPVAGRASPEEERLVGPFVNVLPLRGDLAGDPSFAELLRRVRETTLEAYAHADVPFERLVEALGVARDLSRTPVFQATFALHREPVAPRIPGVLAEVVEVRTGAGRMDLDVALTEAEDGFHGTIEYDADLFDAETVHRLAEHLRVLLEAAVAHPEVPISRVALLTERERRRLLGEWNATRRDYAPDATVHRLVEAQAARTPGAVALTFEDEHVTYAELDARANRLANRLRRLGVGPETLVGVFMERSVEMIVALLGVMKAGGAYVPVDPDYPEDRIAYVLEDSATPVVLTLERLRDRLPAAEVRVLALDTERVALEGESAEAPDAFATPASLAYMIYTSGSTGRPKGAPNSHRNICNRLLWFQEESPLAADDVVLQKTPFSFDVSVPEIFGTLMVGARLVMVRPEGHKDPTYVAETIEREGVTSVHFVPAMLQLFLEEPGLERLTCIRRVLASGEALPADVVERCHARLPWVGLHNLYGPTEAGVEVTYWLCPRGRRRAVPIGRPVANTQIHVLDPGGNLCAIGVPGELFIAGVQVGRGYWRRPGLTAERFVPDPFSRLPGARMYRTGDRARWTSEGAVEYLGRVDFQVKVHGHRIELGEIEAVLGSDPAVREAVVIAREDSAGHRRLVAYVTPSEGRTPDPQSLAELTRDRLPQYMVPAAVVVMDALPLTSSGKVDRRALPDPALVVAPSGDYVAPRTPAEEDLAALWSEVLGIERVGVHDNFFELGGDSILSIKVVARARRVGIRVTPRQVFQHPTVAGLAAAAGTAREAPGERGPVAGPAPLTPLQRRLLSADAPPRGNARVLTATGEVDAAALARALDAVVSHHDALRLRFAPTDDGWTQTVAPPGESVPLAIVDLSSTADAALATAVPAAAAWAAEEARPSGPLLRCTLLRAGGGRPDRIVVAAHPLAVDEASWAVLLADLAAAYGSASRGAAPSLPARTTSFREWAHRLAERAASDAVRGEAAAWLGADTSDGALPVEADGAAGALRAELDAEHTRALLHDVPPVYRTRPEDALMAALATAFRPWTRRRALAVEVEGDCRAGTGDEADLSRTVGCLAARWPVRLELPGQDGPGEALKAAKETMRAVPGRGIGHGLLCWTDVEDEAARALSARPAPEVLVHWAGVQPEGDAGAPWRQDLDSSPAAGDRARVRVTARVADGRLSVEWAWDGGVARETAEGLAERHLQALRAIVAHCRDPEAGGYTPSDFPLARLDAARLDAVLAAAGGWREVEDVYPLTPLQQGMLFETRMAPGSPLYHEQAVATLGGEVDAGALRAAWARVAERHPALRTSFVWDGLEEPLQVVLRRAPVPLETLDWRSVAPGEREERLRLLLEEDTARGFDLSRAPLQRVTLVRTGEGEHRMVWSHHHLVVDGWSTATVLDELLETYAGILAGAPPREGSPRRFRDYVGWLRRQDVRAAEEHWREALAGFAEPSPPGILRPREGDPRQSVHAAVVPAETVAALQAVARATRVTPGTVYQAAWAILLARYGGSADVCFGVTVSGRPAELPGVEEMVGMFVNTLPSRVRLSPGEGVPALLARLQERQSEARQHEHVSLTDVQGWSELPRERPLFDTLFAFQNYPLRALGQDSAGVALSGLASAERGMFPVVLVAEPGREAALRLHVDASRVDPAAAGRMLAHYLRLLEEIAADPARPALALPLLSPGEVEEGVRLPNDTAADYPADRCFHQLFAERAAREPDAVALRWDAEAVTCRELDERANRLANRLRAMGVGPESLVALMVERSPDLVVGILGVMKAGGAYLPLDPAYPAERLAWMLEDSRASVVLTHERHAGRLPAEVRVVRLDADAAEIARESAWAPAVDAGPANAAYVIYTSGSTGRPKGVVAHHRGLVNTAVALRDRAGLTAEDQVLQFFSPSFDGSLMEIGPALLGASLRLARAEEVLPGPDLPGRLDAWGVTVANLTPSALAAVPAAELPRLRLLATGGEALPAALVERWGGGRRFANAYGPTEASIAATWEDVRRDGTAPTIGRPLPNARAYVLDPWMQPCAPGVPGELYIGGDGVTRGYLRRPGMTAERYVPDPFGPEAGGRLYRTGDRVRRQPCGRLEFLGRVDAQVKVRGFRIELGEVEAALCGVPGVREAAAAVRTDGAGPARLVGYVAPHEGAVLTEDEVREALRRTLPEHMVPGSLVVLPALPLGPTGKTDRAALPAPETAGASARGALAPRTPTEEAIASIWRDVLELERVGVDVHFADLGGHSLLATRVVTRIRETLGVEVPLRAIFDAPTVAALAEVVDGLQSAALAGLLAELEGLSPEEVRALLGEE